MTRQRQQAAAAKIRMAMERLKAGGSFRELAMGYSEDPESSRRAAAIWASCRCSRSTGAAATARRGAEQGGGPVSVVSAGGAHTLVLVAGHEMAGQRDLSTPVVARTDLRIAALAQRTTARAAYLRPAERPRRS